MAYGEGLRRNRCGVWCWRWVVPVDVRPALGATTLQRSLGTAFKREAAALALPLRLASAVIVRHVREGTFLSDDNTKAALMLLLQARKARAIEEDEAEEERARHEREMEALKVTSERQQLQDGIRKRDKAIMLLQQERARLQDELLASAKATPPAPAPAGPLLSEGIEQFIREHRAQGKWTSKTEERWRHLLGAVVEFLGDRPTGSVTRDDCMQFFERLRRLPSNAHKKAALKGKTFTELTEADAGGFVALAPGTVNDQMGRVSSFFKWTRDVFGLPTNPAASIAIANVNSEGRAVFTEEDLVSMFSEKSWGERRFKHSYYYWLPLLGFYTGARINELCQLRPADFSQVNGVDVISLANLEDEEARAKNLNARRRVPVHSELVRLGLLRWVDELRAQNRDRIFWTLSAGRDGFGDYASKWFRRFTQRVGVYEKQKKVFHSLRVGFISQLLNMDQPTHKIAAVVGHETGSVTGDIYWKERDAAPLLEMVNMVSIPHRALQLIPSVEDVVFESKAIEEAEEDDGEPADQ